MIYVEDDSFKMKPPRFKMGETVSVKMTLINSIKVDRDIKQIYLPTDNDF